jgi:hypothetical protein
MRVHVLTVVTAAALCLAAQARADMPKSEVDFIASINEARTIYEAQETPAKKTALVKEMIKRWKSILPDGIIQGWTGKIVELGTNYELGNTDKLRANAGKVHLAIRIADRVNLMTWRNAILDLGHGTLISPKSPLYAVLSGLKPGDTVRFDGKYQSFVNLNERAKLFDTDLIVAFSDIAPAS